MVLIIGNMVSDIYLEMLEEPMLTSASDLFGIKEYAFQQDNDPKHTAKVVQKWFTNNGVKLLPWPAYSPDLNPIGNLWFTHT
eukprot:scaffold554_cov297-Ochromonas_danica.AAC.1